MSFDMTRLRRFNPDQEELTPLEIRELKAGMDYHLVEVEGPTPPHEYMCGECTGSGVMLGYYPCKPCGGKGYIVPESPLEDIKNAWQKMAEIYISGTQDMEAYKEKMGIQKPYPNERESSLINARISQLRGQLSKELQKKKSERSQRDINQLQQSINTLTKWKKK